MRNRPPPSRRARSSAIELHAAGAARAAQHGAEARAATAGADGDVERDTASDGSSTSSCSARLGRRVRQLRRAGARDGSRGLERAGGRSGTNAWRTGAVFARRSRPRPPGAVAVTITAAARRARARTVSPVGDSTAQPRDAAAGEFGHAEAADSSSPLASRDRVTARRSQAAAQRAETITGSPARTRWARAESDSPAAAAARAPGAPGAALCRPARAVRLFVDSDAWVRRCSVHTTAAGDASTASPSAARAARRAARSRSTRSRASRRTSADPEPGRRRRRWRAPRAADTTDPSAPARRDLQRAVRPDTVFDEAAAWRARPGRDRAG